APRSSPVSFPQPSGTITLATPHWPTPSATGCSTTPTESCYKGPHGERRGSSTADRPASVAPLRSRSPIGAFTMGRSECSASPVYAVAALRAAGRLELQSHERLLPSMHPQALTGRFRRLLRELGILGRSFHSLRHCSAIRLLDATDNLKLVQELLGHRSIVTTTRYARVTRERKAEAVAALKL